MITIWSLDSRCVVLTGALLELALDEFNARGNRDSVWVIDVEREATPMAIADGFLALWSPR